MRFAHSVKDAPEDHWEPLSDHLAAVGARAADFASWFGAAPMAKAMGLLHDIGKCSAEYQAYIRRTDGRGKGPDHSSAGAKEATRRYDTANGPFGRMLAFGIAGHHSGLMDGAGFEGKGLSLSERLKKNIPSYDGWEAHVTNLPDLAAFQQCRRPEHNAVGGAGFSFAFLIRMLFSCLVDADFLETERFYALASGKTPPARGGTLAQEHAKDIRAFMAKHRKDDTPVNRLRSRILDHAVAKAALPPGLFTLTVPTGGGKTLTSLSFAVEHALRHGLRRIVYVIPFTSIIEQTAELFRDTVGLGDAVLEHHSSFDWDQIRSRPHREQGEGDEGGDEEGGDGLAKLRRDTENWDAPIIVTTAVQFFESLFAARPSQARKLHNLARSVIILDEAQTIPLHLLRPCMAAIDELARNYGASVVLCTATQPALRRQDRALPTKSRDVVEGLNISADRELAPEPEKLYEQLRRVGVEWRRAPVSDAEIAARFAEQSRMLCIVNSRAHARDLFMAIRDQEGAFHLTTLMCARHRRKVLAQIRDDLTTGRPVRLIATSLIEAGVDISFPEVWRAATGLASIAQAAGRCNRNGELGALGSVLGRLVVFEPAPVEGRRSIPRTIEPFYAAARNVLREGVKDVLELSAVNEYYKWLYWQNGYEALDRATIGNETFPIVREIENSRPGFNFPFSRIARAFRMIDDVMEPVIVRWQWNQDMREAIEALRYGALPTVGLQRKLQQYVVPVPSRKRSEMLACGAVQALRPDLYGDRFVILENLALYDEELGLRLDDPTWRSSESNIFM